MAKQSFRKMIRLFVLVFVIAVSAAENGTKCQPDAVFHDGCNTCLCSSDGMKAKCTDRKCPWLNKISYKKITNATCEPKSEFREFCNQCKCSEDGLSYSCTDFECDDKLFRKDGSLILAIRASNKDVHSARKPICEPETVYTDHCNDCVCMEDGFTSYCTVLNCGEEAHNENNNSTLVRKKREKIPCTPGSVSSLDGLCNLCVCNEFGTARTCTNIQCSSKYIEEFAVMEPWGDLYKQGEPCLPRMAFYSECNLCVCQSTANAANCQLNKCENPDV